MLRFTTLSLVTLAQACLQQRDASSNMTQPRFWAYEASNDWARLNPDWELCQTGTQQSPIPLRLDQGLSRHHIIDFHYPKAVAGQYHNWGYGPAFKLDNPTGNYTELPSIRFEENGKIETVYLVSWHIHTPADHSVQGDRSKAEVHFVHSDTHGNYRAVLAMRVDPGNSQSGFFAQFPPSPAFNQTAVEIPLTSNMGLAIEEVNNFSDFWTYKGSLTSPPCTEGLRWFVARNVMFVSDMQMVEVLRASTFSARAEQKVWQHDINL